MMLFPSRKAQAYKLRALGGQYFYVREGRKYRGIFELDPQKAYHMGKTPVYFFDSRTSRPIDAVLVNEMVKFSQKNRLHKVKRKDIEHAGQLRRIVESGVREVAKAIDVLVEKATKRKLKVEEAIKELGTPENITPQELGYILTNYLVQNDLITPEEKGMLDADLDVGRIDYNKMVAMLKDRDIVRINHPLDLTVQTFLDYFGSYNPEQLANFVDMLSRDDKGLKAMTSVPVKTWMPASVILAVLVGGAIAIAVLAQNAGSFGGLIDGMIPTYTEPPSTDTITEVP